MIKHDESLLSTALNRTVKCLSLSGANFEYISRLSRCIAGPHVKTLIIFAGTNTLCSRDAKEKINPKRLWQKIEREFHKSCPTTEVVISHILNRPSITTNLHHIERLNSLLSDKKTNNEIPALTDIMPLNASPLEYFNDNDYIHLNDVGTQALTTKFVTYLQQKIDSHIVVYIYEY